MSQISCISCRRPKGIVQCEICQEWVCKDCKQFLNADTFSFFQKVPEELSHTHYCANCYDQNVAPALESYAEILERARNVYFFFVTQKKAIPLLKKGKTKIKVEACVDRDETILRLAFQAAEQGYNAVVEGEVLSQKARNEGYQKSIWRGEGIPASVDAEKMERWGS